jgi:two-component system, NarL family, sensor kinase
MGNHIESEIYLLLFGGLGIMVILGVSVIISLLLSQHRLMVKERKMLQLKNAHQKELLKASLQSEEKERERIARDLHDEIGAMLSTVKLFLSQVKSKQNLEDVQYLAAQTNELVGQTIQNMRAISKDLSPVVLTNFGIAYALKELASQIQAAQSIDVFCEYDEDLPRFNKTQELMLYRIAQELVNNALKHAQAKQISLEIRFKEGKNIYFAYTDNGKGFDMEKMKEKDGLGLKNIESRSDLLGGSIVFASTENKGTMYVAHFEPKE